jgi:hypothetical protein
MIKFIITCFFLQSHVKGSSFQWKEEYNVTALDYFKCNDPLIDCSNSGVCSKDKDECVCFEGFQTHFDKNEDYISKKPRCNYQSKKQIYAFVLSLFISFGFAHFYLGNKIIGYIQLCLFLSVITFNVFMITKLSLKHLKKLNSAEYRDSLSLFIIICFSTLIFLFWYFFDLAMVFFNIYKDNKNASLQPFV